jgi:hypothetical protein
MPISSSLPRAWTNLSVISTKGLDKLVSDVNKAGAAVGNISSSGNVSGAGVAKITAEVQRLQRETRQAKAELEKLARPSGAAMKFNFAGGSAEMLSEIKRQKAAITREMKQFQSTTGLNNPIAHGIARLRAGVSSGHVKPGSAFANRLGAQNIEASLAGNRQEVVRRARMRSEAALARRESEAIAASPTMRAGDQGSNRIQMEAQKAQRAALKNSRQGIMDFIQESPVLKKRFTSKTDPLGAADLSMTASPTQLRKAADEVEGILGSIKRFGPAGAKTADAVNAVKSELEALASATRHMAEEAEKLQTAMRSPGKQLTHEQAGTIRGSLRDEAMSSARVNEIMSRQEEREFRKVAPSEIMGRRMSEIASTAKEGGLSKRDINIEVTTAANALAESLRTLAREIREADVDGELRKSAQKLSRGEISDEDFRADVTRSEARRRGLAAGAETVDEATFSARNQGASQETIAHESQVKAIRTRIDAIEDLKKSEKGMSEERKNQLDTEQKLLESEESYAKSQLETSKQIDKLEGSLKGHIGTFTKLDGAKKKGIKLTKEEERERKDAKNAIDQQSRALRELQAAQGDANGTMHDAAQASRNFNFRLQQASYGVQDFVQVFGQTGLSGALRASANNMASFFGALGTKAGAIAGGVGTIVMIGLADAITKFGGEAETAEEKMEKLLRTTERFSEIRLQAMDFSASLVSEALGEGKHSVQAGIEARERVKASSSKTEKTGGEINTVARKIAGDFIGGKVGTVLRDLDEAIIGQSSEQVSDPYAKLAAIKMEGSAEEFEQAKQAILKSADKVFKREFGRENRLLFPEESGAAEANRKRKKARVTEIEGLSLSDSDDFAKLGLMIDGTNKRLLELQKSYSDAVSELTIATEQSKQAFERLVPSLDKLESDVAAQSKFSDAAAKSAVKGLTADLEEASKRLRVAESLPANLPGRDDLIAAEREIYDEYVDSLSKISKQLENSSNVSFGVAGKLADILAKLSSRRATLERGLEQASPEQKKELLDQFDRQAAKETVEGFKAHFTGLSGKAAKKFGENQREANNRELQAMAQEIEKGRAAYPEASKLLDGLVLDAAKKMNEYYKSFDVKPDRTGFSGSISSQLEAAETRKEAHDKAIGPDLGFDEDNLNASIRSISDSVLNFSGKVERKLGETQEEANVREKERLQKLIESLASNKDVRDDVLIPVIEMAKRKIDAFGDEASDKVSVTPIESLHQKIQESLTSTKEFDLQKEQKDLQEKIEKNTRARNEAAKDKERPFVGVPGVANGNRPNIGPNIAGTRDSGPEGILSRFQSTRDRTLGPLDSSASGPKGPSSTPTGDPVAEKPEPKEQSAASKRKLTDDEWWDNLFVSTSNSEEELEEKRTNYKHQKVFEERAEKRRKERDRAVSASGQMSVPAPKFDPSTMNSSAARRAALEATVSETEALANNSLPAVDMSQRRPPAPSMPEDHPTVTGPPAPPLPGSGIPTPSRSSESSGDFIKEMYRIRDDLGKTRTSNFVDRSNLEQRSIGTQSESRRDLAKRNIRAMFGGKDPNEPEEAPTPVDSYMESARENVRRQGYRKNVRGGAVTDDPAQRRGVHDGPQRTLTESQMNTINSPIEGAVPGETPEENRARRVAARNEKYGGGVVAGTGGLNTGGDSSLAGPAITKDKIDKAKKIVEFFGGKLGNSMANQAGPEISPETFKRTPVPGAGPVVDAKAVHDQGLAPGAFKTSASGRSLSEIGPDRFDRVSEAAGGALKGGEGASGRLASKGKRTQMREAASLAAVEAREKEKAKIKEEARKDRLSKVLDEFGKIKKTDVPGSQVKTDVPGSQVKTDVPGSKLMPGFKEWIDSILGEQASLREPYKSPKERETDVPDLSSNVKTDATQQVADSNREALEYAKRSADTLESMFSFMKENKDNGSTFTIS